MSYTIIHNAMQNNWQGRGPLRPMTPGERLVFMIVTIVLVVGIVVGGIFLWKDYVAYSARVDKFHQDWDAGKGRPVADKIEVGKTVAIKAHVGSINDDWYACTYKSCRYADFPHYPQVMPVGTLGLTDNCFIDESDVSVRSVMISTNRPGTYSVTLQSGGRAIEICPITSRQDEDKLIIWSDSPNAVR
jgi:hypothetical protein